MSFELSCVDLHVNRSYHPLGRRVNRVWHPRERSLLPNWAGSRLLYGGFQTLGTAAGSRGRRNDEAIRSVTPLLVPARSRRLQSEEHTSELQSHRDRVCRLLLHKK